MGRKRVENDNKDLKELPKLPYGMGSYMYRGQKIRYIKPCQYNGESIRLEAVGATIVEVNQLMR